MPLCFASFPFSPPHFTSLRANSRRLRYFCLTSSHFMPLHFTSHFFCLTSLHFTPLCFAFEIIFTFAKDSDIRKIRIGESFEYLSHLQRFGHSKDLTQHFFPNLSNVLNILLTSLFLQKIQIFERFNSGEYLK